MCSARAIVKCARATKRVEASSLFNSESLQKAIVSAASAMRREIRYTVKMHTAAHQTAFATDSV